jgi:hypothetical protein
MLPGNLPAVRVSIAQHGQFDSKPDQQQDPLPLSCPNPDLHPSTCRCCRVWLNPSVPISGCWIWFSLFIVTLRYATVKRKMMTLVCCWQFWMYWLPWWPNKTETHTLPHCENEGQQSVNDCRLCIMGNLVSDRLYSHECSIGRLYSKKIKRNSPYTI